MNLNFIVINDEPFVLKALLLLTCVTRIYTIFLPRFQQYHIGLDAYLNQDFLTKKYKTQIFLNNMNQNYRFGRKIKA